MEQEEWVTGLQVPNEAQNLSAISVAVYAALQVGCGLARKYHRNLQKVPDLFKSMLKLMETRWLPAAGADR